MKSGLKMGGRVLTYYLVAIVLSLTFVATIGENLLWLQIVVNVALLAGTAYLMLSDGGYRGEKAATLTVSLNRQREEGKAIDPALEGECFSKKTAFAGYALAALVLVLIACANLIAEPFYPPVIVDTEMAEAQVEALEGSANLEDALTAEPSPAAPAGAETEAEPEAALSSVNWFSVVTRLIFTPFVCVYSLFKENPHGLNLLFLLFALIIPLPEAIGYLQGPRLRKKKLEDIQKGKKRKMRNLRVNKKPKERREPKREV